MGALCAAASIVAVIIPFAGGAGPLGAVPMALLAYRYRVRVLVASTIAGSVIAFLIAGMGGLLSVVYGAYIGGLTGMIKRWGRGTPTVLVLGAVAGIGFGWLMVAMLFVLSRLRHLILAAVTADGDGLAAALARAHFEGAAADLRRYTAIGVQYWPVLILIHALITGVLVSMVGWWALARLFERMAGVPDVHKLDPPPGDATMAPGPVPVTMNAVRFRYPGADHDALREISIDIGPGEHLAITGPNGSGKTTLMLILAGREPTSGTVHRPGAVGLGKSGGTAIVLQHPETQVLGTSVADDVVWGLPPGAEVDVEQLLTEVGLEGFGERNTGGLSGGELQRLALAAALARKPAMLIADEVTTMVDQQGRDDLLGVLSRLARRHDTTLVHITHYDNEAASADRTVSLGSPSSAVDMVERAQAPLVAASPVQLPGRSAIAPVFDLSGVSHEYASGTPWATNALRDINLVVERGDGVLIHGGNGSGKSTLAWIMAGLTIPTHGSCLVDGRPASDQVGAVGLSFQAARLQLLRGTVGKEVAAAAGFSSRDRARIDAALAVVGLDSTLADRRIDQLSGGQMRRVVLAGLLARSPKALILDEPLAGLDAASQRGLLRLLEDLRRERGMTVVVISHDFVGLENVCPRTVHLSGGVLETEPAAAAGGAI